MAAATPAAATSAEARLDAAVMRGGGGDRRHRRQGGAVEQTDDDQGEADRAEAGGLLAGAAADDRDADRLVEASRESDSTHRGGSAGSGQRQSFRALPFSEEALPAPRLEGVGKEEEDPGRDHEQRVGVGERPARMHEVQDGQRGSGKRPGDEDGVEADPESPRACESTSSPHTRRYRELR